MRTVCCFTRLSVPTKMSLAAYTEAAELYRVTAADWRGYWNAISVVWGTDDVLLVEHDIELHADVVPQLENCPEPWCVFPYRHPGCGPDGWMTTGLGCTRFRREFQQAVTLAEIAAQDGNCNRCEGQPRKHECWMHLDGRIREAGERLGFTRHIHTPSVGHQGSLPGE